MAEQAPNKGGALWAAAHGGDAAEVRRLLASGADPNECGDTARETLSALHWASWKGNVDIVGALLSHGADHRSVNKWGKTPLHWAAWMGHSDVAAVLMNHGADPSVLDDDGWTPLHLAARFNQPNTVLVMLGSGANPDAADKLGQSARELAVQLNYAEVVAAFDAHGTTHARSEARTRSNLGSDPSLASRMFSLDYLSSSSQPPVSPPRLPGADTSMRGEQQRSPPHHSVQSGQSSTHSAYDTLLEQRYQAQEMLDHARMESDAAIQAAQTAADDRVKAAEQRSAQALSEALAEKARQRETIEQLRQEVLALEADAAAGKAAQSSLLLERQNAQSGMSRTRAQMDATISSIQSAANDRVVEAEKQTAQLRDEYHADTSRLQATIDQLRQTALEAHTETANAKAAQDSLQSELRHAEEAMSRVRAEMEETVAAVRKAAAQQADARVAAAQRAADQAGKLLAEERRLKEQCMTREKECKQRLAEEKRAAWSRLEEERRKLEAERRRHIELSGQIDALTAELEFMRSSSRASAEAEEAQLRVTEQMDETNRRREIELETLDEKQRALQAAEADLAGRLHDCEAREKSAHAAEARALVESENAAAKLKQIEQASEMVKAMQDESAKASQSAERDSVARVAASNARLLEVLEVFQRTKRSMALAARAKDEAVARANEASARADQRAADLKAQMACLEKECQRRLAAAEAMCDDLRKQVREDKLSQEKDIKRQHKELDDRLELVVAQEKQAQNSKAAAKDLLAQVELAVASSKSSQVDVEQQVKEELAQAKAMVEQAQKHARAAVQSAESNATARIASMQGELDTLRSDRATFEQTAKLIAEQQEELQQDMLKKQQQLERSNAKLEEAQHLAVQLADALPESAAEADSMRAQCDALRAELQTVQASAKRLDQENVAAQVAVTAAVEQQEKLAVVFKQRLAQKTAEQESQVRELDQENRKVREAINAVIAQQEKVARDFAEKLEEKAKAMDELKAAKLGLESQAKTMKERVHGLELENQEAKERESRMAQREVETDEKMNALQTEADEWKRKFENSEATNRAARESLADTLKRQMEAEAMQLTGAEKARKRAEARLSEASSELETLSRECADAQHEAAERSTAVARLELEKEQAERTLQEAYNSIRQHAERIAAAEQSSRVDKEDVERCTQDLNDCRMELQKAQQHNAELQKDSLRKEELINEAWQAVRGQDVRPHAGFLQEFLYQGSQQTLPPGVKPQRDEKDTQHDDFGTTKDMRTQLFQSRRKRHDGLPSGQQSNADVKASPEPEHWPQQVGSIAAPENLQPQPDALTSAAVPDSPKIAAWVSEPSPPRHRSPEPIKLEKDAQGAEVYSNDSSSLAFSHIYRVLRPATTRAGFARDSAKTGSVRQGQLLEITEQRCNSLGQLRLRCHRGWLSETARNGEPLLAQIELKSVRGNDELLHQCPLIFRALRGASVREGRARTSRRLAHQAVAQGEIVEAVEGWVDSPSEHSTVRWRLKERGWVSETAANGSILLELLGRCEPSISTDLAVSTQQQQQQQQQEEEKGKEEVQHVDEHPPQSPVRDLSTSFHEENATRPMRHPHVWETDPKSHTQAVALHYSPSEMVQASEDAAMLMVRNAMAAGRWRPRCTGHASTVIADTVVLSA